MAVPYGHTYTRCIHEVEQEEHVPLYPTSPCLEENYGRVLVTWRRNLCLLFESRPAVSLYSTVGLLQPVI